MKTRKTKVRVLGQWVQIVYMKDLRNEDDEPCWGMCDVDNRRISLEADMDDAMYERVLRHEKMHMKLRLSGLIEMMSEELDEALAVLMELKD